VLIPALKSRRVLRKSLIAELHAQAAAAGDVEVLVEEDAGGCPSGAKRNRLLRRARGAYVSFVDDDDQVDRKYVQRIRAGTLAGPDCVSFWLRRTGDDRPPVVHRFSIYHAEDHGQVRGLPGVRLFQANHLCAWRRELASLIGFPEHLGYADDVFWYRPLLASGLVQTELHITAVLYYYHWRSDATGNQSAERIAATRRWCGGGIECFIADGRICRATEPIERTAGKAEIACHCGLEPGVCEVSRAGARRICVVTDRSGPVPVPPRPTARTR